MSPRLPAFCDPKCARFSSLCRDHQRRAIHAVERQTTPAITIRARHGPFCGGALVEPPSVRRPAALAPERSHSTLRYACHRQSASRDRVAARRARSNDLVQGPFPITSQTSSIRRQPSPAQRRGARREQRLFNPQRIRDAPRRCVATRSDRRGVRQRFREADVEIAHDRHSMILKRCPDTPHATTRQFRIQSRACAYLIGIGAKLTPLAARRLATAAFILDACEVAKGRGLGRRRRRRVGHANARRALHHRHAVR